MDATQKAFAIAIQANVPVIGTGLPGIGKTKFGEALSRAVGATLETVIASVREPAEIGGMPYAHHEETGQMVGDYAPPRWALRLARSRYGILLFDEITTAPPSNQNSLLRVMLDKVVGDFPLGGHVRVAAFANPPEICAGGWDLSAPLANRLCHLTFTLDHKAWCEGMVTGWPDPVIPVLPDNWELGIPAARSLVASYIHHRPTMLVDVPTDESKRGGPWPSGRSWDMGARLLAASKSFGDESEMILLSGCVGNGAALDFMK